MPVILWNNAGILLFGLLETKFNETLIKNYTFSFKKMYSNVSFGKWWPFGLSLIVLKCHSFVTDIILYWTHWGRVTHICVSIFTIIGSDNGLLPGRRLAIIWTNVGKLLIGLLGTNVSEISIAIYAFSFEKMHLKMSSGKWQQFCLALNVVTLIFVFHSG